MSKDPIYANYKNALKGAKDGEVVTRFPPEPSGFLHIGHVKAAMLNYHYAKIYNGKMILRFDDTNPMNEKIEFVENIQRDLQTLDVKPDMVTHTSDYFPQIVDYMRKMIKDGNAYADNGTAEEMKNQRDNEIESPAREKTPEENLKTFEAMLEGKAEGWCIRAKMNMKDKFKCLRDPVFYRCKMEPHHRHGTKYKAYPTYDFACPIVDALEGVTHAMRTIEYHDRNGGYWWVQKVLGLRKVEIYDYSRLNLVSTILSKRSLKWFVEEGIADGWEDPRFPTVQGIMRRGMTPEALKRFMMEQGPSKNTNLMEWDKIWAYNKEAIDPTAARYTAIVKESASKLILNNGPEKIYVESHPLHQKNADLGSKAVLFGKEVWIETGDAKEINTGDKITLMKWGNAMVTKKEENKDGSISLWADLKTEDTDYKKTKKVTWIAIDDATNFEITLVELDHLITKKKVEENEKVQDIVNHNSYIAYSAIAEGCMKSVQKGSIIQLERRGYFYVDKLELHGQKMTLNFIPDGKSKNMSTIESKLDQKQVAGGKTDKAVEDAKDKKKKGGAAEGAPAEGLSKKEANKLAKKQQAAAAKAAKAAGEAPPPKPVKGGGPQNAKQGPPQSEKPLEYGTKSKDLTDSLNAYETALKKGQYMNGSQLTSLDKEAYEVLKPNAHQLSPLTHPYTFAWYSLVCKFSPAMMNSFPKVQGGSAAPAKKGKAAAPKKDEDELDDLFGDDDEADAEAAKKAAAAAKEKAQGKKKKVVIAMSLVMLEVKPLDDTIDLDVLAKKIIADVTQDGLFWKTEYKKEPVAFGIFKLIIGFSLEDEKVSVDDVVERIEGMDDMVQSVEIAAFNKI